MNKLVSKRPVLTSLNKGALGYEHTLPGSFSAAPKIIPDTDRVSVHTYMKNGDRVTISVTVRSCAALISKVERHMSHIG